VLVAEATPAHTGAATEGATLLERIGTIRAELAALGGVAAGAVGWAARDRQAVWSALDALAGALTAARSAWLVAERTAGTLQGRSDVSEVAAVDRRTGCGRGAAHGQVRAADALQAMPAVAREVAEGRVGVAHLDALARVLEGVAEPVAAVLTSDEGQERVLELAGASSAPMFARQVALWAATLDPAAVEDAHQAQRRARYLHLSDQADGLHLKGLLDRFSGEYLRRALDLMGQRADDERTVAQARADALEALATSALAQKHTVTGASVRPHVTVVVDAATFAAVRAGTAQAGVARAGVARAGTAQACPGTDAFGAVAPAMTEDGVPVPMSELARTLCDADLSRLVMSADSVPLDLGRTERVYTGAQRRAVVIRDQTCVVGQCAAPARRCEVHHIQWWGRDQGPTSVDGGVLLCIYHHHWIHAANIAIRRVLPDEVASERQRGAPYGTHIRPADGTRAGPVDGRRAGPVDGRCAGPVDGRCAGPVDGTRARPVYEFRSSDGALVARTGDRAVADPSSPRIREGDRPGSTQVVADAVPWELASVGPPPF
jgi:hypothetical protein